MTTTSESQSNYGATQKRLLAPVREWLEEYDKELEEKNDKTKDSIADFKRTLITMGATIEILVLLKEMRDKNEKEREIVR